MGAPDGVMVPQCRGNHQFVGSRPAATAGGEGWKLKSVVCVLFLRVAVATSRDPTLGWPGKRDWGVHGCTPTPGGGIHAMRCCRIWHTSLCRRGPHGLRRKRHENPTISTN